MYMNQNHSIYFVFSSLLMHYHIRNPGWNTETSRITVATSGRSRQLPTTEELS